jgi:flavin-dependent dehydrogenase
MKLSEDPNVPILDGWVNLTEAALLLGITRQHAYKRATQDGFKTLHKVGHQPSYVIATQEIDQILADRQEKADAAVRRAELDEKVASAT